jgi:hypothetical protein
MYGTDCNNLLYVYGTGRVCEPVTLSYNFQPGQLFYLWVGPTVFFGVPESDYVIEISGIAQPGVSGVETMDIPSACCFADHSCQVLVNAECDRLGGQWIVPGIGCDPNPCRGAEPVERSSWGRIKYSYR